MRGKYRPYHILEVVLLFIALAGFSTSNSKANENSKYLDAVREFADNVFKYGRDTYGPKHTPLFVDGLMVRDPNDPNYGKDGVFKPVEWIAPNGDRWVLSNLASQQNFFRTLVGLTRITGDPKYKQAAMDAIKYAFANLRSPNGLLYWGNTTAYDIRGDEVCGWRIGDHHVHVLKAHLPYYELMWQVNPDVTKTFIESFWSAHVIDWSNLAMDRIGQFYDELEQAWRHEYRGGPTFLEWGSGRSFFNAGSDLVYAAASLAKLSGDKEPLIWAKRLVRRYVKTRHPQTGISYGMYTKPEWTVLESYDDVMRRLVPGTVDFLPIDFPRYQYTNPIFRESTLGQFTPTPGISVHKLVFYWQSQFLVGEMLGGEGGEFKQWALEELIAFGKASYRKEDNVYVPMLTDGTMLERYVVKEDGPLGPKGVTLESVPAGYSDLWAYVLGCRVTGDEFMWGMAHSIAKGNELGDIGVTSKDKPQLKIGTDCSDPYALSAFLELHKKTGRNEYLEMAQRIGNNILGSRFHKGFFIASNKHIYTKFDAIDSLVLLHLHSALVGETRVVPQVWPSLPYFICPYRSKDTTIDNTIIYTLTESTESPISLNEAAAMGNTELVKSLIAKRVDINSRDRGSSFFLTPLHHAVMGRYTDIVELLLTEGAYINAKNVSGQTALHYAAMTGRKDIAGLLIAKGADVNAKNNNGQTPVDIATNRNRREVVELLIAKGADVSLRVAVRFGSLAKVRSLIEEVADINTKDGSGQTSLHYVAERGLKDIAELLIANGADVNAKNNEGKTPVDVALGRRRYEVVKLLIEKGADVSSIHLAAYLGDVAKVMSFIEQGSGVNTKHQGGGTPLHYAVMAGSKEVSELLLARGADIKAKDRNGATPLHWGSVDGHRDLAEFLITKGADIDARDDTWGETPLHWVVSAGHRDVAELLIVKGADVNAKEKDGKTPLQIAKDKGHDEIVELLRKHGAKE